MSFSKKRLLESLLKLLPKPTLLLVSIAVLLSTHSLAIAADLSFDITTKSVDDTVTVSVTNTGKDIAPGVWIKVDLGSRSYKSEIKEQLFPQSQFTANLKVQMPLKKGSYPLYTTFYYLQEDVLQSLVNVGYFNVETESHINEQIHLPTIALRNSTTYSILHSPQYEEHLFLPHEINIRSISKSSGGTEYKLVNTTPLFNNNYAIFYVLEDDSGPDLHSTSIYNGRLQTTPTPKAQSVFTPPIFAVSALLGLFYALLLYRRGQTSSGLKLSRLEVSLIRWGFSLFVVSLLFLALHTLEFIPELFRREVDSSLTYASERFKDTPALAALLRWFYFEGGDYDYFVIYITDGLFIYFFCFNLFTLYYLIRPSPETDKYWHLMESLFSILPKAPKNRKYVWTSLSKVGLLSILVKAFYVPLLSSWTINNIFHQRNLTNAFQANPEYILDYVLALLILVDVTVFAVGYMIELPQLRNQIRSVEPTILGWVVCLMCYPPFNQFSLSMFDQPLQDHWPAAQDNYALVAKSIIVIFWAIYCWATIALGFKASNLTNRGIVGTGPYRFVRHPAYAAKLTVWVMESFVLARLNFFFVVSLVIVYGLRAWTEDRHLSQDPDYLAYKQKVRWWFIPKIF